MAHNKGEKEAAAAVAATAASLKDRSVGAFNVLRGNVPVPGAASVGFNVGILGEAQGSLDIAGIRKSLEGDLDKLFKATKTAAKGGRSARVEVVERIREFAAKMTGRTPDQIPNVGLKSVRKGLISAVKAGATKNQIGAATALLLEKHLGGKAFGLQEFKGQGPFAEGVVKKGQRSIAAGEAGRGRLTGALEASGAAPSKTRKFLSGSLGKLAGGFAGFFAAEFVAGNLRERRENKADIEKILREGAGAGPPIVDPNLFLNFLGDQGPEFQQAIQSNPQLAIALFDRLQSMAGARIPTGSAVLRTSRAEGVSADSLLSQFQ